MSKTLKSSTDIKEQTQDSINLDEDQKVRSSDQRALTLDEALTEASTLTYQIFLAFVLALTFNLSNCIKGGFAWLELKPNTVILANNSTMSLQKACQEHLDFRVDHGDEKYAYNWMDQFDQYCLQDWKVGLFGTTFFIGYVVGSVIFLPLSDLIGRKMVVWWGLISHCIILAIITFTLTRDDFIYIIYIYLFIFGVKASMTAQVAYVLLCEIVLTKYRPPLTTVVHAMDSLSNISIYLYFYYVRDWRYMMYFSIGLTFLFIFLFFLVPESPRYFVAKNQYENAHSQYNLISKVSCKKRFKKKLIGQDETTTLLQEGVKIKNETASDLFKTGKVAIIPLIVITWFWFANNFIYYGLQVGVKYLNGNLLINGLILYGAVMLAMFSTGSFADLLGRKWSLRVCYTFLICGGVAYLSVHDVTAKYILLLIATYGVAGAINIDYMVCSELFPTSVRGVVFGIANVAARVGASISPLLEEIIREKTLYIYAIFGLICLLMVQMIRQTRNQPLLTTLQDLKVLFGPPQKAERSQIFEQSRVLREGKEIHLLRENSRLSQ